MLYHFSGTDSRQGVFSLLSGVVTALLAHSPTRAPALSVAHQVSACVFTYGSVSGFGSVDMLPFFEPK
jgi:hypothetical protein